MDNLARNGFIASILHDIGKLAINKQKQWPHHWDLYTIGQKFNIDFPNILGEPVLDIIKTHHGNIFENGKLNKVYDLSTLDTAQIALALADNVETSLTYQKISDKGDLNQVLKFNPFFGHPHDIKTHEAHSLLNNIAQKLKGGLDVKNLIEIQTTLLRYPHLHFYPHISLGIHHRLTAALYLILYQKLDNLDSPTDLKELTVYLTEVDPQPMKLFYRLRDIVAYSKIVGPIDGRLYGKYFRNYNNIINFNKTSNPFTFYYKDGLVFLSAESLKNNLKNILEDIQGIDSLEIKTLKLTFPFDWKKKNNTYPLYVDPRKITRRIIKESLISDRILAYPEETSDHCQKCGIPISKRSPEGLCNNCHELEKVFSSEVDIDTICEGSKNVCKIAYVFLNTPPLMEHGKEVADHTLINRFIRENRLPMGSIQPTRYGFLEYLQALQEIEEFQGKIEKTTDEMRKKNARSYMLFQSLEKSCVILRADFLWKFLDYLNTQRYDLKLDSSATVFITRKKTPFWSLMNNATEHKEGDILYDATRGEIVMFSAEETRFIRELAAEAYRKRLPQYQLNRLSKFALRSNKPELMLEIDRSADKLRGLENSLKGKLKNLEYKGTELQNAEKRSIFLKYVADLIKVKKRKKKRR